MHVWQMQEAKSRLSEVIKTADSEGPQEITIHGKSVAVVPFTRNERDFQHLGLDVINPWDT